MTKPIRNNAPDPEKYALSGSEDSHQISLFMWAASPDIREQYPELVWLFHIPNGGSRHKAEAGKLRAMGVKRGVPDICLPVRRGPWACLWIELKKPKAGRVSDEQNVYINQFKSQGHAAMVCVGWQAARDVLIQYLEWKE